MGYSITAPLDTNTPGVTTSITQSLDLNLLDTAQWTRLTNAAKSGLVTGCRGYLSLLAKELAKQINTLPPFIVGLANSWQGTTVEHPWAELGSVAQGKFDELMQLSDMRHRLQCASDTKIDQYRRTKKSERHRSGYRMNSYLSLVGWSTTTDLRKFLTEQVCNHPEMIAARKELLAYIETKPTINIVTKEF